MAEAVELTIRERQMIRLALGTAVQVLLASGYSTAEELELYSKLGQWNDPKANSSAADSKGASE